ncbi:MAG: glycosyltransferase family 4 protein [Syntrophaceae bacterium]|jgi:UDP-glucose:(heptosyl)LPS alpha-1,3-glucosyltransferase|nr:glycosyltransferase family 4 protein [Syntrophaceae bacterium]
MPKIAVIIPKYGLVGGAEQFAAELTGKLCSRPPHTFQVFANRWQSGNPALTFAKIPIISFPKFLTTVSFAWFVQRRLAQGAFDLVHSHERIFAADLFTLHGIPHRFWVRRIRQKSMSLYDRATAWVENRLVYEGGCRKFVAVSGLTKAIFLQEFPVDPDRVAVIHPGVNLSDYDRPDRDETRRMTRLSLGVGPADALIIFASMNFEIKGLDDILVSLGKLKRKTGRFKLIVAGKGNVKKYSKLAREAGIADNVLFAGVVSKERLVDFYLAGDLYLMLSRFDTFGMVVLEAMAAGLPVMISKAVGARDLVREGENGFVVSDPSDHEQIVSRLEILFDADRRRQMAEAACRTAAQNTWDRVAEKYENLYGEILAAKQAAT